MSVLSRSALEDSPLADLHTIAGESGLEGFRRLRKADLVDAILAAHGIDDPAPAAEESAADEDAKPARAPRRRGGRTRRDVDVDADEASATSEAGDDGPTPAAADEEPRRPRTRTRRRGGGERSAGSDTSESREPAEERQAEGVIEVLGNGSGFLRVNPPDASDDDVYVSAAQIRRCELVSGDRVTGPVRAPRRSERYPSLVRIEEINGKPADEVAEGTHFDDLASAFPTERFSLGADDPTLKAIEWLTPLGRGTRATITGEARSGKSEALRRLAAALSTQEGLELSVVLVGVRPEETAVWREGGLEPVAALGLAAAADAQAQAVDRAVETAKRVAARGGDAVVLVDTLDGLGPQAARRTLAAARNIVDGGSLTVVATASAALGGETTVIALDAALTSTGRFPALDLVASGTLRPELLVGPAGADAIAQARAAAIG